MGAYGAMNLGTKRPDWFGVIGSLGGPVDMRELLRHVLEDNLEVKAQTSLPSAVGDDFTFDHLPPYPDRDTRLTMANDLVLAFGNPFLHHPDPGRRYLAVHSEPAATLQDDEFGSFSTPAGAQGFLDGGDANQNGLREVGEMPTLPVDSMLVAKGSGAALAAGVAGVVLGERELFDLGATGLYDVGDGIVRNPGEPFDDLDGDREFEPAAGETFDDLGLDGVAGTGDFGEGNGAFDVDPDRATWLAQDPLSRIAGMTADQLRQQRIYMDVGTRDLFGFEAHYANLVATLAAKGLPVVERSGFDGSCLSPPEPTEQFLLIRYDGGHIGIPAADDILEQLATGDVCGGVLIWQRLLSLIGFVEQSFPGGDYGPGGLRPTGDVVTRDVESPALTPPGGATVTRPVVVYRPPAFFNTAGSFPVVYFLGGYGQSPSDFERVGVLLDLLIAAGEVQNLYFVFLPGQGGHRGSFYVDHVVPHDQVPGLPPSTGRYEASLIEDLIRKRRVTPTSSVRQQPNVEAVYGATIRRRISSRRAAT